MTMSDKAREIADRPAFPVVMPTLRMPGSPLFQVVGDGEAHTTTYSGMTYHRWLVGQALAGPLSDPEIYILADAVKNALISADAVCEALAEREP